MNKKLIGLLLALSIPLTTFAEMNEPHHPDGAKHIERMAKELGLSDEQKTKVEAIFEAQHEKFKALHEETKTSLQAVLTPEQFSKLEANREKHKEDRREERKEERKEKEQPPQQ